jgi:glycosyltransferase involved in cell wall biosynthesis
MIIVGRQNVFLEGLGYDAQLYAGALVGAVRSALAPRRRIPRQQKSKRVLMVVESLARGGAERQLIAVTQGLLRESYEVEILDLIGVATGQANFAQEISDLGVAIRCGLGRGTGSRVRRIPEAVLWRCGVSWAHRHGLASFPSLLTRQAAHSCKAIARAIDEFDPGAVNCWSDYANVIGGLVAAHRGVPRIVLGLRTTPPLWLTAAQCADYRRAYLMLIKMPGLRLVNNSQRSALEFERWLGLANGTIGVVYNGFLSSLVQAGTAEEKAAHRARLGIPPHAPVVGTLMRLVPQKDPELWLETAAVVAQARPNAHFLLGGYGHPGVADGLAALAGRLGLGDRLVMTGAVTDIGAIYNAMDVFLMTSRFENTPNTLIEAQAAGIPVVGPDVGGVCETMLDQVTGILVQERYANKLAAAVLQILDAPDRLPVTARAQGPAFVAHRFSHERMVREMIAIYG